MTARERLRRAMDKMLPWPSRAQRKAAIETARAQREDARAQREAAEAGAAHANVLRRQIEAMREQNHFAAAIADQIIARHREGT